MFHLEYNHARIEEEPGALYVYKRLVFRISQPHERDAFYHELRMIWTISTHQNTIAPPVALVLADEIPVYRTSCVGLHILMKGGSSQEMIDVDVAETRRLSLEDPARWCYQVALSLSHTHSISQILHMDFKPSDLFLDDNFLGDLDQTGATWGLSFISCP